MYKLVPHNAKIYVCRTELPGYLMESNPLDGIFSTEYDITSLDRADFIVYFRPLEGIWADGYYQLNDAKYAVTPLYFSGPDMAILKVAR